MTATPPSGFSATFRALQHPNYRLLWLGGTGHAAALWMDQVSRSVLVLELTDSAFLLSVVIAVRLLPVLLLGLIAGAIADRVDRKRLLIGVQTVTLLIYLTQGALVLTGVIEFWHVLVTALAAGTTNAFNQPVRQSLIPTTVPQDVLLNAIALNSMSLSLMRIIGGSLAGALLIVIDVGGVYLIQAAIYGFIIATTAMLAVPARPLAGADRPGLIDDLKEGFAYVGARRELTIVTAIAVILFVFGMPYQQVFVPLLAKETLDLGNSGVGFLAGASGVGAVIGSAYIASRASIRHPALMMVFNLVVLGGALVAISLQQTVPITVVLLAVAGAASVTYMALTNSILLTNSDPHMHGRVMSLLSLDRGLIPLGAIIAGTLASTLGIRPSLFVMGSMILLLSGSVLLVGRTWLRTISSEVRPAAHGPRAAERKPVSQTPTA